MSTWISHRYRYVPILLNPPPTPSYPSRWSQSTGLSSLVQQIPTGYLILHVILYVLSWYSFIPSLSQPLLLVPQKIKKCCLSLSREHKDRYSCLQSQRTLSPSQDSDGGARALFREMRFLLLWWSERLGMFFTLHGSLTNFGYVIQEFMQTLLRWRQGAQDGFFLSASSMGRLIRCYFRGTPLPRAPPIRTPCGWGVVQGSVLALRLLWGPPWD